MRFMLGQLGDVIGELMENGVWLKLVCGCGAVPLLTWCLAGALTRRGFWHRTWKLVAGYYAFTVLTAAMYLAVQECIFWVLSLTAVILGPMLAFGLLVYVWMLPPLPRYPAAHCSHCGYNLTGNVSGVCPECSTPVTEHAASPSKEPTP
jgi:hypothetical protein